MIADATILRGLPCAVVDFEATGFAGPSAHAVEVAIVHAELGSDTPCLAFTSRVRPPVPIPEAATAVHGITDADVAHAPTWADIAPEVWRACEGRIIVGYNAPADFTYWSTEQERIGGERPPWPWLDLLVVRKATKTRGRPGRLAEVAAELGIVLDAHGAAGDALTTALLLTPLMRAAWWARVFPDGALTWGTLWRWQRKAALEQEESYCDYALRSGRAARPQCAWHEIEGVGLPPWPVAPRTAPCLQCLQPVLRKVGQDGLLTTVNPDGHPHTCGGER